MQCRLTLSWVVRKRSKVMAALENEISRLLTKGGLGVRLNIRAILQKVSRYDAPADVSEVKVQWRSDFQSGYRVSEIVLWPFSYPYLWHAM